MRLSGWHPQVDEPGSDATVEVAGWFEPVALTVLGAGGFEAARIPLHRGLTTFSSAIDGASQTVFELVRSTLRSDPSELFDYSDLERRQCTQATRSHKLPLNPGRDGAYPWPIEDRLMEHSFDLDPRGASWPCAWLELEFDTDGVFEQWPNPGGAHFHAGMIGWRYMTARNLMRAAMDTIDGVRLFETLTQILVDEYIEREPSLYWGDDEVPAERLLDLSLGYSGGLEAELDREPTDEELGAWLDQCAEWAQIALSPSVDRAELEASIRSLLEERRQCLVRFPWGRSRYLGAPLDEDYSDVTFSGTGVATSKRAFDDLPLDDPEPSRPVFALENNTQAASNLVEVVTVGERCVPELAMTLDDTQVRLANSMLSLMLHDPPQLVWEADGLRVRPERYAPDVRVESFSGGTGLDRFCFDLAIEVAAVPMLTTARILLVDVRPVADSPEIDRVLAALENVSKSTGARVLVDVGEQQRTAPAGASRVEIRLTEDGRFEAVQDKAVIA